MTGAVSDTLVEHIRGVHAAAERLFDAAEVEAATVELGARLREDYRDEAPVVLCVMIGGLIPTAAVIRHFDFPFQLDYLHATRYRGHTQGGALHWRARPEAELEGRVVLIVDDILDEGWTLRSLVDWCRDQGAASVASAVLAEKRLVGREPAVTADYSALAVPDRYVFGSGMDYRGYLRNAEGIFAVAEQDDSTG